MSIAMNKFLITAPKLNANDEYMELIWVEERSFVKKGQIIFSVESTKSVLDIESPADGYVYLKRTVGDMVKVNDPLGYVFKSEAEFRSFNDAIIEKNTPDGKGAIFTEKALIMIEEYGLNQDQFSRSNVVTSAMVRDFVVKQLENKNSIAPNFSYTDADVALFGTQTLALLAREAIEGDPNADLNVVCYIDYADLQQNEIDGLPLYHESQLSKLLDAGLKKIHICVADLEIESRISKIVKSKGFECISIIHPSAVVSSSAKIGQNCYIGPGCIVGPYVVIGDYVRLLNGSSVAHHSIIGNKTRISDGARVAGKCTIGESCLLGINSAINMKLQVGSRSIILSGVALYESVGHKSIIRNNNIKS